MSSVYYFVVISTVVEHIKLDNPDVESESSTEEASNVHALKTVYARYYSMGRLF